MKYGTLVRLNNAAEAVEKFETIRKWGLDSCQLVYKPKIYNIKEAETIKREAKKKNIEISAFFAGYYDNFTLWDVKYDFINAGINSPIFGESRLKYILSAIPFVRALGVTDIVIHAGFIPNNPFSQEYAIMISLIKILAENAKKQGCNILFETGDESPIILLRVITDVDAGNLFINFDTGNIIMNGFGNPCEAVMTFGRYIRNIHAKDGLPPTDPYKSGPETPIGEGVVDFKRVFSLLKEIGYDRYVTIEREISGDKQIEDIKAAFDYLKSII